MKKIFTLILFLEAITFFAQGPVILGTYFPVRNTSIKQVWDTTHGSMNIPSIGPNQVWDYRITNNQFTHVIDTFQAKMIDPAATPTRCSQYFPNATHASFVRIPFAGSPLDSSYTYFEINQNGIYNIGSFNIQHQYDSTLFNNPKDFYTPAKLTYLTTRIDTAKSVGYAKHYYGYSVKLKETRYKTSTYVGYGTLKLPNGTYNNVALVKAHSIIIDSGFVDFAHNGNYIYNSAFNATTTPTDYYFLRNNTFASSYLMYLEAGSTNTTLVTQGWYTLPVDFGSISGTVFTNTTETTPVNGGQTYLYRENSNFTKNDILATANIDANGNYNFDSIPYGEYRIAFRPNTTSYPNSLITYYGDSTNWIDASTILTTTTTSTGHKIHLRYHNPPVGSSNIEGQLGLNLNIMRTSSVLQSNPIPGIGVVVKRNPGSAARMAVTDSTGKFSLGSLDNGNYILFVDIPGLHMAGTYSFNVSGANVINGLDFTVGTDSIHPINATTLGIKEFKNSNSEFMSAYPNPYNAFATIVVNVPESANVLLEVYDMLGKKVQTLDNAPKQQGLYKYTFSAKNAGYGAGMYFVKLKTGNVNNVLKIIEQ